MNLGHHAVDLRTKALGLLAQALRVRVQPRALHLQQHQKQRHLHLAEQPVRAVLLQKLRQARHQRERGRRLDSGRGHVVRGLRQRAAQHLRVLVQLPYREVPAVRVEQVSGNAAVKQPRGVHVLWRNECRLRGIHGAHLVEKRLRVARDKVPLAREPRECGRRRIARKPQEVLRRRDPQNRWRLVKERRLLAPLRVRALERRRDPRAGRDRGVQALLGGVAGKRPWKRKRGLGLLLRCVVAAQAHQALRHAREAERGERLRHLLGIERGELRVRKAHVKRRVRADRRDLAAQQRVVYMGAQVLAHLALNLVRVRDHVVEASVLHDEGRRLLRADAGHAGDVVRRVALQAVEVRHELWRDAVVEVVHALRRHDRHV